VAFPRSTRDDDSPSRSAGSAPKAGYDLGHDDEATVRDRLLAGHTDPVGSLRKARDGRADRIISRISERLDAEATDGWRLTGTGIAGNRPRAASFVITHRSLQSCALSEKLRFQLPELLSRECLRPVHVMLHGWKWFRSIGVQRALRWRRSIVSAMPGMHVAPPEHEAQVGRLAWLEAGTVTAEAELVPREPCADWNCEYGG